MQAFCNLESKSLQATRTPDFKSCLELPKAFLFDTLFSLLPFSSFSLFWHHLQNTSVTKTPRCFSYSAHSISTKTGQGFMEKKASPVSVYPNSKFLSPSIHFLMLKKYWERGTSCILKSPYSTSKISKHVLSQFPFRLFLLGFTTRLSLPFWRATFTQEEFEESHSRPIKSSGQHAAFLFDPWWQFKPTVCKIILNLRASEKCDAHIAANDKPYRWKSDNASDNATPLLQKDRNINQSRHFIFPVEKS